MTEPRAEPLAEVAPEAVGTPAPESQLLRDLGWSIALMAVVVALALIGLATEGNWPKILRVSLSFVTYAGTLLAWRNGWRSPRATLPFLWFASAGAAAGVVSGLVRTQFHWSVLLAGTAGAALLLGGVHWLGLMYWRLVRAWIAD